jgi:hypothetical protein
VLVLHTVTYYHKKKSLGLLVLLDGTIDMKEEPFGLLFCFILKLYMMFCRLMLIVLLQQPKQHSRLVQNGESWMLLLVENL